MKKLLAFLFLIITSCNCYAQTASNAEVSAKKQAEQTLDFWHQAAANANFEAYFSLMTKDAVFIGTDASENWQNKDFREYAKPYFDNGKAWSFKTLERNIYFGKNGDYAWFDELLDTQMGICRGSGVLVKKDENWKIKHYVLSITIPNENVDEVIAIKKETDQELQSQLQKN
ncbi:nuclear transport factor 2 family protein [Salegentibacter sp. F188]|uniref:Nuclear transport factor 2 family protein n=1 Tax=Autumnicola patrickiae TaxID=3075591 RepID=A0ABU3E5G4_9FLAO|nr:nuclear transport factor 2 family protein [Salegentibacter sp. F188]MDT0690884.1 nuclear transport factor 2 family protein [Salegentibacter sp. F188]